MVALWQEVRVATRTLVRAPLFSVTVVLTIGLAVGAVTAAFSVTNAVLIRSLPFAAPDRLVWIASITREDSNYPFSLPEFLDYREQATTIEGLAAIASWSAIVGGADTADRVQGIRISSNAFETLGVKPAAGRLLNAGDDDVDAPRVAVLSFDLWQRRFGGREQAVGATVLLNGEPFEIVGILPRHFPLSSSTPEVAVPLSPGRDPARALRRSVNSLRLIGRLRPGVTREQAEAELNGIARRLRADHPDAYAMKLAVSVTPLHGHLVRNYARGLTLLSAAAVVALLVACGNLINLLLARAAARGANMSVRLALGATLMDVARTLWLEMLQLSIAGGLVGVGLAAWALSALSRFGPGDIPRLNEVALDPQALGFGALLALAIAAVLALIPLWALARRRNAFLAVARDHRWSRQNARIREAVIAVEAALAVILLLASMLLARSFVRLQEVEPGFALERRIMARLALPRASYRSPDAVARFADRFTQELGRMPGVNSAGGINVAPLSGVIATANFSADGVEVGDPRDLPNAHYRVITEGYLRAMGIPIIRGRGFTMADDASSVHVALINQRLAVSIFPGADPIGRRIRIKDNSTGPRPLEIVGVVGDVRQTTLDSPAAFDVYVPMRQAHPDVVQWLANNQFWAIQVSGGAPSDLATGVRRALRAADPSAGIAHVRPLEEYIDAALAQRRFSTMLSGALAGIAVTLVIVGLYGVIAYSVAQRTREIGLRSAIGATRFEIWCLVSRHAVGILALGAAAGLVVAVPALGSLEAVLFETEAFDPALATSVVAGLLGLGLAAASVPAYRAARIDPVKALRD